MFVQAIPVVSLLVGCVIASPRNDYRQQYIEPYTRTSWGTWGTTEWCPAGTFAHGFKLKMESKQGSDYYDDDTALNAIGLYCRTCGYASGQSKWIYSKEGTWGRWTYDEQCPRGYVLAGARARSESNQGGSSDDTAANSYRFQCRSPMSGSTHEVHVHDGYWGSWSNTKSCPSGQAICGIKTRVENPQGRNSDDTALNSAIFYCCQTPRQCD